MKSVAERLFDIFENKITDYYKSEVIRTSQVQMAFDIAAFLDSKELKRIMFIEAPVGTGKSLGALIPTMLYVKDHNKNQVVYATATINLQSQLKTSELRLLQNLTLVKQPIMAMGKNNYYCHKEFRYKRDRFSSEEQVELIKFFNRAETGQRNEYEESFKQEIAEPKWSQVMMKATKRECDNCEDYYNCPSIGHRNRFTLKTNDLIITNHSQLIQSVLNTMDEFPQPPIIPVTPGVVIIDEAHHFIENYLNAIEEAFTLSELNALEKYVPDKYRGRYVELVKTLKDTLVEESFEFEGALQGRYVITENILEKFSSIENILKDSMIHSQAINMSRRFSFNDDSFFDSTEMDKVSKILKKILSSGYVKWVNYEEKKFSVIAENFPTDFKKFMDRLKRDNKIVIMSGTLTTNGDFEPLLNQWRLNKTNVITKRFDTPFDYSNQALVYVPEKMVVPSFKNRQQYSKEGIKCIKSLIDLTEGRSLILTTSKADMTNISKEISGFITPKNIKLFIQDQSGVEKLTKQFRENETSVLIGSGSFFSGFSIQGQSLISVILTKLPFPVPDDPFLKLIGQGYEDEFFKLISFPNMMNKLNQAAGRLIRDITDFGVFTILDPRVFIGESSNFTGELKKALREDLQNQGYKITRSFDEVSTFIKVKLEKGAESKYQSYHRDEIQVANYLWDKQERNNKVNNTPGDNFNQVQIKSVNNHIKEVTKAQIEFVEEICKEYSIKSPTPKFKKTPDLLYKYLVEKLFWIYEDQVITEVQQKFPFNSESEQKRLLKIKANDRMSIDVLKCSRFGCDGSCCEDTKEEIMESLKKDYGAESVMFDKSIVLNKCLVRIQPTRVIVRHFMKDNL